MNRKNFYSKFFKNKKVFITGHTGFKGSWLTQMLLNFGADISGYSLKPNTNPNLFAILGIKDKVNHHMGDIRDYKKLSGAIKDEKPEIVFHLAAQPLVRESYDNPLYTYETNVIGTANVLQSIKEAGMVKSAVVVTTDKVYEDKGGAEAYKETDALGGYDPYSTSKVCAEHVTKSYIRSFFSEHNKSKTLIASARSGNVIGGGDWSEERLVPDIVRSLMENKGKIVLRNPDAIRPWQFVLEPSLGYIMLSIELYNGNRSFAGAWNFAPEDTNFIKVQELVRKSIELLKRGSYSVKKDKTKHETAILKLDSTKARKNLNWKSVFGIDEALEWTYAWYRKYYAKSDMGSFSNKQIELFLERY